MTQPAGMTVAVYDSAYRPRGQVPNYISCSVTWQWMGVGSGTLVVDENDPIKPLLLTSHLAPVLVVVTVAGQRWSGRVANAAFHRQGPPGSGTVTATLVDDWAWLMAMEASQNGSNASVTGMPQYDTQTGPAATVAAYYINAAAQRLGVPVAAVTPLADQSAQITLNARMDKLADLLTTQLKAANVACPASIWLPGDDYPLNLTPNRPTVIFTPGQVQPKPWLRWSDSTSALSDFTLTVTAPTAYRAVLGLDGQDAARNYDVVIDTALQAQLGEYALPEMYADESSTTKGTASQTQGAADLAAVGPTASASLSVLDGKPFSFGKQYVAGDVGSFSVSGIDLTDRITQVTAADDRSNGLVFTPVIGDNSATATSDELLVDAIASIARQVRAIQTGR